MWESLSLAVCFFCLTPPPHFSHYSSGPRFYNSTFTKNFMPDPHSSTEPHKSDRNSQEWRASPLRPASRHGHASRTQHSSAKHTEHDQHSEQAELFTILKVLSKNLSRISLVMSLSERNSFLQFVVWRFFLFACFCFPGILSVLILQIFSSYRYRLLCAQQ